MKVAFDRSYLLQHRITPTEEQVKSVLVAAGLKQYYLDPSTGDTVFEVESMPEDKPLFGIKWVPVTKEG